MCIISTKTNTKEFDDNAYLCTVQRILTKPYRLFSDIPLFKREQFLERSDKTNYAIKSSWLRLTRRSQIKKSKQAGKI